MREKSLITDDVRCICLPGFGVQGALGFGVEGFQFLVEEVLGFRAWRFRVEGSEFMV